MRENDYSPVIDHEVGYALREAETDPQAIQTAGIGKAGKWFRDLFPDMFQPQTPARDVIQRRTENAGKPKGPTREELEAILADGLPPADAEQPPTESLPEIQDGMTDDLLQEYQQTPPPDPVDEMRTDERNINIQRHHQGAMASPDLESMAPDELLENLSTAEDIGRLLDASAKTMELNKGVRTQAEVAAEVETPEQIRKTMQDVFRLPEGSALNDAQLLATRRILSTLGAEVTDLANRITQGDSSAETLLLYQKKGKAFSAFHAFLQGKVSMAARALAQQRMIARTIDSGDMHLMADFNQFGDGARTPEDVLRHAALMAKRAKKKGVDVAMAESWKPSGNDFWKAGVEYWMNNILSGVETHVVNFTSVPVVKAYEDLIIRPIAGGVGKLRTSVFSNANPDRIRAQEHTARMMGSLIGMADSLQAFGKALLTGDSAFGPEKGEEIRGAMQKIFGYYGDQVGGETGERIGHAAGSAMTGSFRLLQAEDGFWKMNIFRSEYTALVMRDAYAQGVDPAQHLQDAFEHPEKFPEAYEAAMEHARKYTFTETERPGVIGDMARTAKDFLSRHPYLKFIVPFVDTPMNLIHYAAENSVLAPLSKELRDQFAKGGVQRDIATARVIAGTALTTTAWALYDAGVLTGGGPDEYNRKEVFKKLGAEHHAVYIGGEYYVVDRFDPFAMSVFAMVDAIESARYARKEANVPDMVLKSILSMGNHALDATWMKGMKDFLDAVGNRKDVKKYLTNYVPGLIPYGNFIKTLERVEDPQVQTLTDDRGREMGWKKMAQQRIEMGLPGYSAEWRPARYWDGTVKHPRGGKPAYAMDLTDRVIAATWPIYSGGPARRHAPSEELIKNGLGPTEPSPILTLPRTGISFSILSLDQGEAVLYDKYVERVGQARLAAVEEVIATEEYKQADAGPNSTQQQMLQKAINDGRRNGMFVFLEEDLPSYINSYPMLATNLGKMVGMDIDRFILSARNELGAMLPPDVEEKVQVRGISEVGRLPLPPHIENKPEF